MASENGNNKGLSYRDAGVDIEAGNDLVRKIGPLAASTRRPGSDAGLGGFGGFFDPRAAGYNDPRYIVEVALKYPSLRIVITHYFWPRLEYCYEVTRDTPNIYLELAATADDEVVEASGGIGVVRAVIAQTIRDRPDQVMFGSDWPMCRMQAHLDLVNSLDLDRATRNKVLDENAAALYDLPA